MKPVLILFTVIFLTGCAGMDTRKFPDAEKNLMVSCPELSKLPDDPVTISQLMTVVVKNYTLYHQCANKVQGWHEWYEKQKNNFEGKKIEETK